MKRVTTFGSAAGILIACSASLTGMTGAHAARLTMTIGPGEEAARMTPHDGSFELTLPLSLRAGMSTDGEGFRITGARLMIKDEGQEAKPAASRVPVGDTAWQVTETFTFEAAAQGPLAQNARAACASSSDTPAKRRASMLVPVVWHVTTGSFGYVRLAAGGLQPNADMLADAGFYGDQQEEEVEAAIAVTIECPPLGDAVANTRPAAEQQTVQTAKAKSKGKIAAQPDAPAPSPVSSSETSVAGAAGFTCEGGMVRETLAGPGHEVCLCPGNTARRQTGERAFSCDKRFARKR